VRGYLINTAAEIKAEHSNGCQWCKMQYLWERAHGGRAKRLHGKKRDWMVKGKVIWKDRL